MYISEYFRNTNFHQQVDFIKENSFGILITHSETKMFATHIPLTPLVIDNNLVLHGHISKENPQCSTLSDGNDALVIFQARIAIFLPLGIAMKMFQPGIIRRYIVMVK